MKRIVGVNYENGKVSAFVLTVGLKWMEEIKMYKPLADSTLQRMKKTEIIELLRIAEHNARVAQE